MNTCTDLHEDSMKRPISMPFGGSEEIASAASKIGCTGALREQFQAAQHPCSGQRVDYEACSTSAALRTTFRTRRKPDAPPRTIPGICCMYAAQQLDRTPQRNQIEACVSRPAAAKISAWRTFRGRTLANAKATCDAMSPERRSRCQVRATNLSPIRLLLPPAAAAKLASDATEAAAEALQARQETAKLSRTLAERRAHSRRRLWAKRTHTAATQLQQAWRCRVARDERARRAEAQAALARRKEAARLRLATREAEVREECEKRRQGRAAGRESS